MTQQGNISTLNNNLSNIESNFVLIASEIRNIKSMTQPTDTSSAIGSLTTRVSTLENSVANLGSSVEITYEVT